MRRRFGIVLAILIASAGGPALAETGPALLAVDAGSGRILAAELADTPWRPASLTKMMTAYLAFAAIESGRLSLDDEIVVSAHAAGQSPVDWGLSAGERITLGQAIAAMIVVSANDAAVAVAEAVAGSESAFAAQMTAKAREIGMRDTRFANASGLPDPGQVTNARDMAILALRLIEDFPQFYDIFSARQAAIGGRIRPSVNGILGAYPGADGMKTGFTCDSGYNLVASARRGERRIIGIVLGARSRAERLATMTRLLDAAFALAPEGDRLRLGDRPSAPMIVDPPQIIAGAECRQRQIEEGIITDTARLRGWGIIFGAFPDRARALAMVKTMRAKLAPIIGASSPALIERQVDGVKRYSALLTGLDAAKAGAACKALWAENIYCLALRPEVIANPKANWR